MIGLLQRVSSGRVIVDGKTIGEIQRGLVVFIGVERADTTKQADRLLERLLAYRVFPDKAGKMNLSVREVNGGLLLVPQFTLAADTRKGMRPSFTPAAPPEKGEQLFNYLLAQAQKIYTPLAAGQFGADMQVELTNEGPVTFWLQTTAQGET